MTVTYERRASAPPTATEELAAVGSHDAVVASVRPFGRAPDAGFTDIAGPRITVRAVAGLPLLHVEEPELQRARRLVKAGFDHTMRLDGGATDNERLDLYYVENWSPALDVLIMFKTVAAVLTGRGAY